MRFTNLGYPSVHTNWEILKESTGRYRNKLVHTGYIIYTKDKLPKDFMYVNAGIKGPKTEAGSDQKRVSTPGHAVRDGSSILVIGRAITDPRTKAQKEESMEVTPEMRVQAGYEVLQDMAMYL